MDNTNISKDKHQRIVLVIAMIGVASLLSLGAVASTTITPAFAGGDDDGVKQKAEADNDCDQKNKNEDGDSVDQFNEQFCIGISANVNDFLIVERQTPCTGPNCPGMATSTETPTTTTDIMTNPLFAPPTTTTNIMTNPLFGTND